MNKPVPLQIAYLTPPEFMYTFMNSSFKEIIKESYTKYFIELGIVESREHSLNSQHEENKGRLIRIANYTDLDLEEYEIYATKNHKNISKLGL
jgi:hypothetical protein